MDDRERLRLIIEDCESDARENDGLPFTGESFGLVTGRILAMIDALAKILLRHLGEET